MTSNTTLPSPTDETRGSDATTTADATTAPNSAADDYRVRHDFGRDRRLSTSVALAVANALGTDPLSLDERLYDALDPDALDRVFAGEHTSGGLRRLSFDLAGCSVTVRADGRILVRRSASAGDSA